MDSAVDDLEVLEVNDAACHRDIRVILQDARGRRTHHPSDAAGPVFPPPGAVHRDVEGHEIRFLGEAGKRVNTFDFLFL